MDNSTLISQQMNTLYDLARGTKVAEPVQETEEEIQRRQPFLEDTLIDQNLN